MTQFTGTDVYGIRWWVLPNDDDGEEDFLSYMKYETIYPTCPMTKGQVQHAMLELENLTPEEFAHVLVQVYVYVYPTEQMSWWHVDKNKIRKWFFENC
jgi:hypothetical protein